jgi:hypothetical protein
MCVHVQGPREPEYGGKPLTHWLRQLAFGPEGRPRAEAEGAVRAIGTNVIPYLLHELAVRTDSRLERMKWSLTGYWPWRFTMAYERQCRGAAGLKCFRERSELIVPELCSIATNDPSASRAVDVLASLGEEGVTPLIGVCAGGSGLSRMTSASYLERMVIAQRPFVVRKLVACLNQGRDVRVSDTALQYLRLVGAQGLARNWGSGHSRSSGDVPDLLTPDDKHFLSRVYDRQFAEECSEKMCSAVVPVLRACLKDLRPVIRMRAALALEAYAEHASSAVGDLRVLLDDPDAAVREASQGALQEIENVTTLRGSH